MDGKVKIYPTEVKELGGTTNSQADLMGKQGHDGFLHVEMSLPFRQRLKDEPKLRATMLDGLKKACEKERGR